METELSWPCSLQLASDAYRGSHVLNLQAKNLYFPKVDFYIILSFAHRS
jgi:hypothetical protein